MTPEQKQIAIAEACGWRCDNTSWYSPTGSRYSLHKDVGLPELIPDKDILPDYLNDLNAMHEAEKVLTYAQKCVYADHLGTLVEIYDDYYDGITYSEASKLIYATATQRADAFLLTIGKWKE